MATLASVLKHYGSLVNLDMSQNQIGAEGAKRLSEALKANSTLLKLKYAASPPLLPMHVLAFAPKCQRPLTFAFNSSWQLGVKWSRRKRRKASF